jgi:hypothetical protein
MEAVLELAKKATNDTIHTRFSAGFVSAAIPISAALGILFALWLWQRVAAVSKL